MLSAITERTAHEEASDPVTNVVARFESRQLKAVGKILRGHDESPARIALLKILFLIDIKAIPKEETVLKNIPNWQGSTPTPHQLIMMAGGTIGGKEALT
jgi:hypothetical protein